ncbi:MAG: F0F1 ATP synthase subunit epsilon [Acidithiobacillus sp.]|uniref:F0F1 ATP synthase subunit epsilon n=1 Tax=Acidithiobacillus ferriphilus TaxID=1689834 RepID=UPI0023128A13|nr:F0F1 ATP synthase subunit epsilon [Acidithiobacillus ferriphilus]MDA8151200.1 F0F1 ATP synthase subunit epsilon [Acidithiobacillus sp.]
MVLSSATRSERIGEVLSFVGEDASGSFGILAGHGRMMTILAPGLARFRGVDQNWRYLASPGGVLYFYKDSLSISTRRYLLDDDYERIADALERQLLEEENQLRTMKESLRHMEEQVLKRMWEMSRQKSAVG